MEIMAARALIAKTILGSKKGHWTLHHFRNEVINDELLTFNLKNRFSKYVVDVTFNKERVLQSTEKAIELQALDLIAFTSETRNMSGKPVISKIRYRYYVDGVETTIDEAYVKHGISKAGAASRFANSKHNKTWTRVRISDDQLEAVIKEEIAKKIAKSRLSDNTHKLVPRYDYFIDGKLVAKREVATEYGLSSNVVHNRFVATTFPNWTRVIRNRKKPKEYKYHYISGIVVLGVIVLLQAVGIF